MSLNIVCVAGNAAIYIFLFFSLPTSAADVFRLNSLPENESKQLDISASFFEIYSGKVTKDGVVPLHLLPLHPTPLHPTSLHPTPLTLPPHPHLTSLPPCPLPLNPSPYHHFTLSPLHPLTSSPNQPGIWPAKQKEQVEDFRGCETASTGTCSAC